MAAIYGVLVEFRRSTRLGWGLPFGAAVWLGAHVITVPALGLSEPVTRSAPAAEATEFAAHIIYGAVAEGFRRLLPAPKPVPFPLQLEMRVPFAPKAFPNEARMHLLYELHLTNFATSPHSVSELRCSMRMLPQSNR